jgi:hypothetical protein
MNQSSLLNEGSNLVLPSSCKMTILAKTAELLLRMMAFHGVLLVPGQQLVATMLPIVQEYFVAVELT